jgi:hypothetical protein
MHIMMSCGRMMRVLSLYARYRPLQGPLLGVGAPALSLPPAAFGGCALSLIEGKETLIKGSLEGGPDGPLFLSFSTLYIYARA